MYIIREKEKKWMTIKYKTPITTGNLIDRRARGSG